jgi:hypothetical protein
MESPKTFQSAPQPVADPALRSEVIIPGAASNSPQAGIRPNETGGDSNKKDRPAETAGNHDDRGNAANQPPKEVLATPKSESAQK